VVATIWILDRDTVDGKNQGITNGNIIPDDERTTP
jgi:hypothetical protein